MDACDVLIVGGGPAGSSCASALRRTGLDVLVIDRRTFPRDKVCGGWITPLVIADLSLNLDDYAAGRVLQPISSFRIGIIGEHQTTEVHYGRTVSYGIRRFEFDHYLVERSQARLSLGKPVEHLDYRGDRWTVNGTVQAPLLIGAGGHFCPVARHLGARKRGSARVVTAQEIEFPLDDICQDNVAVLPEMPELYFCPDMTGYGWCFHKGNFLNIGLGVADVPLPPNALDAFIEFLRAQRRVNCEVPSHHHGHAYQLYDRVEPCLVHDGALLVGDAAGLAYPQSGEGIRPAIESGLLAAEVATAAHGDYRREKLQPYVDQIIARFGSTTPRRWTDYLPQAVFLSLAQGLVRSSYTARHVVLDRWFLHADQSPLSAS